MLLLTGKFKNKEYDNQPISPNDLAVEFGLPDVPKQGDSLELRLVKSKIKQVPGSSEKRSAKSIMPVAKLNGTFSDGSTFILRYVRNVVDLPNGQKEYLPKNIVWTGLVASFKREDYEKFVFLSLHTRCASSPFAGAEPWFELVDPAKEAAAAERMAANSMTIMKTIWDSSVTPDELMRLKAAGLVIKGESAQVNAKMPIASVRQAVYLLAMKHPEDFLKEWQSIMTVLNSLLMEAQSKNILEFKANTGAGRSGWVWNSGERSGMVACYTTGIEEPFRALKSFAASRYDEFMSLLTQTLGDGVSAVVNIAAGVDIEPSQSKTAIDAPAANIAPEAPSEMSWPEKVIAAVERNLLAFDVSNGDVRWRNEDGIFELKAVLTGQSVDTWLAATKTLFTTNTSAYHRKVLNSKLGLSKEA